MSLYLFEIAYKLAMGAPLLIHHLTTLLFFMLIFWKVETQHSTLQIRLLVLKVGILLVFQAITEQQTFVALMFCILL
jgi:hypothetical protein